jgi:2-alkenal reductase
VRTAPFAAVAIACALLGGVAALALGKATGWLENGSTTTIFRSAPAAQGASVPVVVGSAAKPLAGNGFNPARIYASRSAGVVTIVAEFGHDQGAQGSGFVVSPKGYILTSSHVITTAGAGEGTPKPAKSLVVEFQDRDRVAAKVVGFDIFDDVGVIKVDPSEHALRPVPLGDSATVTVGAPVAAIGTPFGKENSLSAGVVSATRRSIDSLTSLYNVVDAIQTDAAINHGNSGGPLFDARGRVIGINAQINSNSGNAEGVGFAVPINSARRSMEQLIADGTVSYAYVGVETEDLTPSLAKRFGYPVERGAVVTGVRSGSPAEAAGLHAGSGEKQVLGTTFTPGGDLIVAINGRKITSAEDIVRIVTEALSPGDVARFSIVRGDTRRQVRIRLAERPTSSE